MVRGACSHVRSTSRVECGAFGCGSVAGSHPHEDSVLVFTAGPCPLFGTLPAPGAIRRIFGDPISPGFGVPPVRHFPIAAVLVLIFTLAPSLGLAQGLPPVGVTLGSVEERTVHDLVTGVATVEPWLRSTVAAEIAGYVESYPLREGQEVVAGETVVCELKKTTLKIDLAEAEALLLRARAEAETSVITARATMEERRALMDRAERDLARSKELFADQVINKSEFDRAEAEAIAARFQFQRAEKDFELAEAGNDPASMAAEAEVRRAEARLARVQDQIAKATILAPVSGRVLARRTEVGNWVSPGGPVIDIVTAFHDASRENRHVELASTCDRPAPLPADLADWTIAL